MAGKSARLMPAGTLSYRDRMWASIRKLRRFTRVELEADCGHRGSTVLMYLKGLVAAGYLQIEMPSGRHPRGRLAPATWSLIRDVGAHAPRVRRDGQKVTHGQARLQQWRAIRRLKEFNAIEVAYVASTEEVQVSPAEAQVFLSRLYATGYFVRVQPARPGHPARYRLLPSRDTGPLAPIVQHNGHIEVYDPNVGRVMRRDAAIAGVAS